jgi:hypothetical protein
MPLLHQLDMIAAGHRGAGPYLFFGHNLGVKR